MAIEETDENAPEPEPEQEPVKKEEPEEVRFYYMMSRETVIRLSFGEV